MREGFDGPRLGDRYVLGPLLGRGAVGEVRAGWDEHLRRPVAVKRLMPGVSVDAASAARFRAEGIAAARLTSPRIVALLDIGEHEGSPFLVMERLSGLTWADELRACRPGDERVLAVADDILIGLQAVHAAGIVHRDVKPSNVLLMDDGAAKLADFGIAHTADLAAMTLPGMVVGSFAYMAPERLAGAAPTPASDVWSVGVLVYESLTGQRPFNGDSPLAVAAAIQRGSYPALQTARPGLPTAIGSAVESALHPDPAARPPVAHLRAALALQVPTGRAPVRVRPAVGLPAWGGGAARETLEQSASAVLSEWLEPQHGTEQVRLAVLRRGRVRAWAMPSMIMAGVTATVVVATLISGADRSASAGAQGAGVPSPQVAATPDAVRERIPPSSQTSQTVRPASTAGPDAGKSTGHTNGPAASTQSGLYEAARRQAGQAPAADRPDTKVKKQKARQAGKRKGKAKG